MKELLTMGLLWFYILAEVFVFFMKRTTSDWRGANQVMPVIITAVWTFCSIALIVLTVFIFIRIRPWWYGVVMIVAGFLISSLLPIGKTGETIVSIIGIVGAPLFVVLSFLKVFAVI